MPVAPESPSSQHSAPAPADQYAHHQPLPSHQRTGSGNVLLSELAAAASAASRGVVLPPLRSLVDSNSSPDNHAPPPPAAAATAPAADAAHPQPSFSAAQPPPGAAESPSAASRPESKPYPKPPVIALSQAPPSSQSSSVSNAMALQTALNADTRVAPAATPASQAQAAPGAAPARMPAPLSEHLQAPAPSAAQAPGLTAPGLRVPSPSRSSVSSIGSHESAVSPVTPTAAAPATPAMPSAHQPASSESVSNQYVVGQPAPQQPGQRQVQPALAAQPAGQVPLAPRPMPVHQHVPPQLAPATTAVSQLPPGAAMSHHRVLAPAPAPSPLMPSPQTGMAQLSGASAHMANPHASMAPGQQPHAPQHQPPQHQQAPPHQHAHQQHPQHLHHGMVPGAPIAPRGAPPAGIPGSQAAGLHPQGAPQIVYVNPYGYPVDSMPYMYPTSALPHPHYGYAPPHAYPGGAPVPMMHMPPQQQVSHPSLGPMPPNAAANSPGMPGSTAVGGAPPMDMKPGMPMPPHMMQPWAHTFSQEIKRRTRTGCLTCRRRRVKCDEQHPQCRNCLKSERVCLGYDVIFSFDRAKRVDHLMHRRRLYRASRDSRARVARDVSLNPVKEETPAGGPSAGSAPGAADERAAAAAAGDEECEERTVLRSWSKVVELFRNRLAGPLDELLGSDMFVNIARRTGDYLNAADQRFVNVAGELEAMRQLLAVVYPSLGFEGLNILESQIALEKLRTTEDYCLLRGVAECLTSEESGASMQEMISPTAAVRRTIHQQHLQRIYLRLAFLHRVLHPDRNQNHAAAHIESAETLNRAAEAVLAVRPGDQRSDLTDLLWTFVEDAIIGASGAAPSHPDGTLKLESVSAVVKLAERNDARGVLALLALYARRPSEGELHEVLNSLSLQGLPMALLEIGMASRA